MVAQPHFLLFCDTHYSDPQHADARPGASASGGSGGRWHFVLEQLDGPDRLEAADNELTVNRERLALLSVVRGLEALEQPSQVTLVTTSRYVSRGLRYGLTTWREADYMWERFGEQRPIRNSDLWRRVDTALQFHGVKCRLIQAGETAVAAATEASQLLPGSLPKPVRGGADGVAAPKMAPAKMTPGDRWGRVAAGNRVCSPARGPFQAKLLVAPSAAAHRQSRPRSNYRRADPAPQLHFSAIAPWWSLAAAWIRWWRGRLQAKPGCYAT